MIWNHDISAAPRGRTETKERTIGKTVQQYDVFVPERVLIVDENMKVYASYWLPQQLSQSGAPKGGNRWSGWSEGQQPIAWAPWPEYKFQESPRKAAEAVAERAASSGATVASGLVEADKAEAVAGGLGQPELIPALTAQHGGVNVGGPERADVTGGESAATSFNVEGAI